MKSFLKQIVAVVLIAPLLVMQGCKTMEKSSGTESTEESFWSMDFLSPSSDDAEEKELRIEEPKEPHWVRATGYAPISLQPGATRQHKILMAMRASKLRAYQELAGVVHGQYMFGTTQVKDMLLQSDEFKTAVSGIVRGARVVKTFPVQEDTYATTLEVDMNQVQRAWVSR